MKKIQKNIEYKKNGIIIIKSLKYNDNNLRLKKNKKIKYKNCYNRNQVLKNKLDLFLI